MPPSVKYILSGALLTFAVIFIVRYAYRVWGVDGRPMRKTHTTSSQLKFTTVQLVRTILPVEIPLPAVTMTDATNITRELTPLQRLIIIVRVFRREAEAKILAYEKSVKINTDNLGYEESVQINDINPRPENPRAPRAEVKRTPWDANPGVQGSQAPFSVDPQAYAATLRVTPCVVNWRGRCVSQYNYLCR